MKTYGKKKLQGKNRKNPANRKSVYREIDLAAMALILKVVASYEEAAGGNLNYAFAQALLDRLTPEVPSVEAFAVWVMDQLRDRNKRSRVSELAQFSADSH